MPRAPPWLRLTAQRRGAQVLGLREGASAEDIVNAKNAALTRTGDAEQHARVRARAPRVGYDAWRYGAPGRPPPALTRTGRVRACAARPAPRAPQVDAAYDVLLMQSLSRRRSGQGVSEAVKFADAKAPRAAPLPGGLSADALSGWAAAGAKAMPAVGKPPAQQALAVQGGVFAAAGLWALALGATHPLVRAAAGRPRPGAR